MLWLTQFIYYATFYQKINFVDKNNEYSIFDNFYFYY